MRVRLFVLAAIAGLALVGCHRDSDSPSPAGTSTPLAATDASAPAAHGSASERAVWDVFHRKYPRLDISSVAEVTTDEDPMYVVEASGKTFATTAQVNFIVDGGSIIVGVGDHVRNVTAERGTAAGARLYTKLPFNLAITQVYGKGERQLVMFSDPDCPVCQAFEKILDSRGAELNATIHTFSFPLLNAHPDAVRKAAYLMCTANPGAEWHDWMVHADMGWDAWAAKHPSKNNGECTGATRAALGAVLARQLGFSKTPTLMFANGQVLQGAPTLAGLEQMWAQSSPTTK